MHRFFIDQKSILKDKIFIQTPDLIHQIKNVLRLKIGHQIIILDNFGFEYLVNLEKIDDQMIEGYILKKEKNKNEQKIKIILLQSLLKHDKFEQVLKFGTNLGLAGFIPIITQRSVVKAISQNRFRRYKKIIKESAEQSGRGLLPFLENLMTFEEALNFIYHKFINQKGGEQEEPVLKLIAWEEERKKKLSVFKNKIRKIKEVYLCVGPEGGLTKEEVLLAKKYGFLPFSLGRLILRAEIAGLVASSLIFFAGE
ncbi:MAG: 16S rRNA (uracil(1498)-N(3))-methyltransferase [Patescibacteria group bacterium]|nr:16S rRNA (uracil(1498)-N(3))-methyltransferase [Patescibacteria group bacterium]